MNIDGNMVPIVLFIMIAVIVKIVSENHTRQKLIETGTLNENAKYLFTDPLERHIPSSLKWGMVMIAVGLALLVGQMVPSRYENEVTFAMIFILAGLALLIFYVIGTRRLKKEKEEESLRI